MKKRYKRTLSALGLTLVALVALVVGGSFYMLDYSLSPDPNRRDVDSVYRHVYAYVPDLEPWVDSLRAGGLLRDTFITMDDGRRSHAIYLRGDTAHGRTAILVHGFHDSTPKYLFIGRMYQRDLGYNLLVPDLAAHGLSDGEAVQMGWKDRLDVKRWTEVARGLFAGGRDTVSIVVHGVSMGAATTMCLSGEPLPAYVHCFVEDCGYTSAWDEFAQELRKRFALPEFPLMYSTSLLCKLRYGWSFDEASPLRQVAKCRRPMLFVHGGSDTFVPTAMAYSLYEAKPQPKELWIAPGSEHARSFIDHPGEYTERVRAFARRWME